MYSFKQSSSGGTRSPEDKAEVKIPHGRLSHALYAQAVRMTECSCFASALQVSDQLHRTETALSSTSFDQVLSIARHASAVCRQYAACARCSDPSYFTIYIIVLRKAVVCYNHLARLSSTGSSPGTASTASSGGSSQGWSGGTSRLRIGNFEVEAAVDDNMRTVILRTEVRRAANAASQLESVLGPGSVKASGHNRDEATLTYQRGLVAALREEVAGVERALYTM
jgi:hypothetical protein